MQNKIAGVLLAGGKSNRMGGGDKCLMELAGRTLLSRVIDRAKTQVGPMVLNVNGDPKRFASYRLPIIKDVLSGFHGPLAGILTGLDWAKKNAPDVDYIATFATDSPFFPSNLVELLYKTIKEGHVLACAKSNGRHHPVFGLWPVEKRLALQDAMTVESIRKIDIWTSRYKMGAVDFPTDHIDPFFNVNTPEDLAQARDFLNQLK